MTFLGSPPQYAVLVARRLPPYGFGDTLFMSTAVRSLVVHPLSHEARCVRAPIIEVSPTQSWPIGARHRHVPVVTLRNAPCLHTASQGAYDSLPEDIRRKILYMNALHTDKAGREAVHPIVTNVNGRPHLFVNRHFTRKILPPTMEDDTEAGETARAELLEYLFTHLLTYGTANTLRLSWSPGDLVTQELQYGVGVGGGSWESRLWESHVYMFVTEVRGDHEHAHT